MLAVYCGVAPGVAERLGEVEPDRVVDYVDSVLEAGAPSIDVDTAWEGLHLLLTGRSASDPVEDDPLSEAVVGVYEFESDDFLGVTPTDELTRIVAALEALDLDALLRATDSPAFTAAAADLDAGTDRAADRLREAFGHIVNIHRLCLADGLDLLVSIY